MFEYNLAAAGTVARTVPKVSEIRPGTASHYGLLIMSVVMIGLRLLLLAIALLTPTHQAFVWIGIILGGGGLCSLVFVDGTRLPAGTRTNFQPAAFR